MKKLSDNKPRWLTIGQASKYLGVSRDTLRRWEKAGKIKAVRSPTNRRYYTQKQLDQIMGGEGSKGKSKKTKPSKTTKLLTINPALKLILIGLLSCAAAAGIALLLQLFVLK